MVNTDETSKNAIVVDANKPKIIELQQRQVCCHTHECTK